MYSAFRENRKHRTWRGARLECQKHGGDLVSINTREEWSIINKAMKIGHKGLCAYIGLQTTPLTIVPAMYR